MSTPEDFEKVSALVKQIQNIRIMSMLARIEKMEEQMAIFGNKSKDLKAIKWNQYSDEDLQKVLEVLDKQYFKGVLTDNGVKAVWSNRMTKNIVKTHNGNPIEIRVSQKLLYSTPQSVLITVLRREMSKAYMFVTGIQLKFEKSETKLDPNLT